MAVLNVFSVSSYLLAIFVFGIPAIIERDDTIIGWIVYFELTIHNTLAAYFLSRDAGFQLYIYLLIALPFFILTYKISIYLLRMTLVLLISIIIEIDHHFDTPKISISSDTLNLIHIANLIIFLIALGLLSYLYSRWERDHTLRIEHDLIRDPLTGLYNRRYLDYLLKRYAKSERVGLILIDIDHFKQLNDHFGHECGDRALIALATILQKDFYDSEAIRWGGEEFLLLYRDVDKERLMAEAERLRSAIESNIYECVNQDIQFTLTTGVTLFYPKVESFIDALSRADRALYRGKESGRNRNFFLDS